MCGIAGHWAFAARALSEAVFTAFNDSQAHRGPDGSGVALRETDRLWLGHRRLAIIDVSDRGRQPMVSGDGRYWLTYNGEIYNYLELREELRALGHQFVSDSDSEVILEAYAQWGEACQLRFNGMWAFAIWDDRDKVLFLSRDRFGVKPLHYSLQQGCFSFASELKAFLALPGFSGALDEQVLAATLININGQESTPYTLLPGVSRLPGGYSLRIDAAGACRVWQWWKTLDHIDAPPSDFGSQVALFREQFLDACRIRLRSDVSIATSLSGGLDSSAVACSLAELRRTGRVDHAPSDWHRAFVACFPGTSLDESDFARTVADHAGMAAQYENMDDTWAVRSIEKVVFDLEGIYWVPLIGPWSIYGAMRGSGIRVSLDGHGADELLGGYHFFVERALDGLMGGHFNLRRYLDLKTVLSGLVGGSGSVTRAGIRGDLQWLLKREMARLGLIGPARRIVRYLLGRRDIGTVGALPLSPDPSTGDGEGIHLYDEAADDRTKGMPPLSAMMFSWFHGSVLPTILRSYDRASMAHGIEVRMPFMDWRLVTLGFALPESSKIGGGYTKRILRSAMHGLMPEDIRLRTKKIGFTSPLDEWGRGALKPWLLDTVSSQRFLQSSLWDGAAARHAVEQAVLGAGSLNPIWPILNAHILGETFRSKAADRPSLH